jgi:hypothetical protein
VGRADITGAGGGGTAWVPPSSPQEGVEVLTGRGAEGIDGGGGGLRSVASSSLAGVYAVPYSSLKLWQSKIM